VAEAEGEGRVGDRRAAGAHSGCLAGSELPQL
jgi:hypothetical protein